MKKLQFYNNKVLKLTNVLKYKILLDDESFDLNVAIEQMQSYIRAKGPCRYTGPETSLKFAYDKINVV